MSVPINDNPITSGRHPCFFYNHYEEGHLWLSIKGSGLYYSTDSRTSFTEIFYFTDAQLVAVGPAMSGSVYFVNMLEANGSRIVKKVVVNYPQW